MTTTYRVIRNRTYGVIMASKLVDGRTVGRSDQIGSDEWPLSDEAIRALSYHPEHPDYDADEWYRLNEPLGVFEVLREFSDDAAA